MILGISKTYIDYYKLNNNDFILHNSTRQMITTVSKQIYRDRVPLSGLDDLEMDEEQPVFNHFVPGGPHLKRDGGSREKF